VYPSQVATVIPICARTNNHKGFNKNDVEFWWRGCGRMISEDGHPYQAHASKCHHFMKRTAKSPTIPNDERSLTAINLPCCLIPQELARVLLDKIYAASDRL
jgi:hypothetical protein